MMPKPKQFTIMAVIFANGLPHPFAGWYVKSFDFDAYGGQGDGVFTKDRDEAIKFDSWDAAFMFWRTQSKVKPLREDGKPNKPLTSTTVEITAEDVAFNYQP